MILQLVVRRIVVGTLGTGNVERRLGEAAKLIHDGAGLSVAVVDGLRDLNPDKEDFVRQLARREFNKGTLRFLRSSIIRATKTPNVIGHIHFIWTPQFDDPSSLSREEGDTWGYTLGNSYLSVYGRRPPITNNWYGIKTHLLPYGVQGEWESRLQSVGAWDRNNLELIGHELAEVGAGVWY